METTQHESNRSVSKQNDKTYKLAKTNNKKLRSSFKINQFKARTTAKSSKSQPGNSDNKSKRNKVILNGHVPNNTKFGYRDNRIAIIQHKIEQESKMAETNSISLLRRFTSTNIVLFVILYSIAMCLQAAVKKYTEGVSHQPEYKYYFTRHSSVLFSVVQTVGLLLSLAIVAFFARNAHKPFFIFVGLFMCSLGSMVWSVPSFLDQSSFEGVIKECSNRSTLNFFYSEVCLEDSFIIDKSSLLHEVCNDCVLKSSPAWWSLREMRLLIMCLAVFAIGFGGGMYASLGFLYIDESNQGDKSCLFYSIILSMMGLGQFIGSFMAWWFLKYDENFSKEGDLKDHEIRAWWLGTVLLSILFLILSVFFLIFPKWTVEPNWVLVERYENINVYKQLIAYVNEKKKKKREQQKKKAERANKARNKQKRRKGQINSGFDYSHDKDNNNQTTSANGAYNNGAFKESSTSIEGKVENLDPISNVSFKPVMTSTIEFDDPYDPVLPSDTYTDKPKPKVSRRLGRRCSALRDLFMIPSYSLFLLAVCFSSYFVAGYRPVSQLFVHHQYNYTLFNSWFYTTGLSNSLSTMIGSLLGGMVIYKTRMLLKNQILFMIIALIFHCAFFCFIFPLSCNPADSVNYNDTSIVDCLDTYACNDVQREPVCVKKDSDLLSYPSPCHAACSISRTGSCSSFKFSKDSCQEACPTYWIYWFLLFMATLTYALPSVTVVLIFLRSIDEKNKTLALSTAFWIIKLIAFIPARGIFDEITMNTCQEVRSNCLDEMYCWKYHNNNFRYILHGSNMAFQAACILCLSILFFLAINNIISIDYQHLINNQLDSPEATPSQVSVVPSIRSKGGVDAIRKVPKMNEIVSENNQYDTDQQKQYDDGRGSTKAKLKRHLQVVEMQLEKQNTPRGSNDDLTNAKNNLLSPSDNETIANFHRNSEVPVQQPKDDSDRNEKYLTWSNRDLRGMNVIRSDEKDVIGERTSREVGLSHESTSLDLPVIQDMQLSNQNIDIL